MLQIDQTKRAKLEDILKSEWISEGEKVDLNVEQVCYEGK